MPALGVMETGRLTNVAIAMGKAGTAALTQAVGSRSRWARSSRDH
jgi:hypothetical protein